ncbi:hypothetical protein GTU75_06005 [Erysipelothrix rhusiopathiae]|nr:hypothetical protein [Erysipelothrix rhusiopathiae]
MRSMRKGNQITLLFLLFAVLIGCQAPHQTPTLITDKSSINHPFIVTYVTGKFSDYGYSVNQDEQIKIYKDSDTQWTFSQTAPDNTENIITVMWDGQSEIAETIFVQVANKVVYKR